MMADADEAVFLIERFVSGETVYYDKNLGTFVQRISQGTRYDTHAEADAVLTEQLSGNGRSVRHLTSTITVD